MKRLTDKRMKGEGFIPVNPKEYKAFVRNEKPTGKQIYQRLLEIEDILGDEYELDRLRDLVEADRDGRCVVLPCPVGTTVYMPFCSGIVEKKIGQFHINGYTNPRIWADIDCDWATTQRVRWDLAFGKTVFLTREAAEAALKGEHDDCLY